MGFEPKGSIFNTQIRPKNPLLTDPKILENEGSAFFLILNFAFLNKNVETKC